MQLGKPSPRRCKLRGLGEQGLPVTMVLATGLLPSFTGCRPSVDGAPCRFSGAINGIKSHYDRRDRYDHLNDVKPHRLSPSVVFARNTTNSTMFYDNQMTQNLLEISRQPNLYGIWDCRPRRVK